MQKFYSHGKLLLTAEYAVLDGAKALAVPTKFGQFLEIKKTDKDQLSWESIDETGKTWYKNDFRYNTSEFHPVSPQQQAIQTTARLTEILNAAAKLKPGFFSSKNGFKLSTTLEFNRKWGLGSSSTLIYNLASWLKINPYALLAKTFGGSGYDIAAAGQDSAFTYQLTKHNPISLQAGFNPSFKDRLFFVYLNKKQNSREAISHYRNQPGKDLETLIEKISGITESIISCDSFEEFCLLLDIHETLISKTIKIPSIKKQFFPDFSGSVKSLGGWGGDFILATGGERARDYFKTKGFNTIFSYKEMILNN